VSVLHSDDFWTYLFTMCHLLYAPIRVLHLADQKIPTMDKLHYYVCQTDANLLKYISKAQNDAKYCKDTRILSLMNVVSKDIVDEVDEGKDSDDSKEVDNNDNGFVAEASTSSYNNSDASDGDDDADPDVEENVDISFVNKSIGDGTSQLRQVLL
jgi:hypothetical protein